MEKEGYLLSDPNIYLSFFGVGDNVHSIFFNVEESL